MAIEQTLSPRVLDELAATRDPATRHAMIQSLSDVGYGTRATIEAKLLEHIGAQPSHPAEVARQKQVDDDIAAHQRNNLPQAQADALHTNAYKDVTLGQIDGMERKDIAALEDELRSLFARTEMDPSLVKSWTGLVREAIAKFDGTLSDEERHARSEKDREAFEARLGDKRDDVVNSAKSFIAPAPQLSGRLGDAMHGFSAEGLMLMSAAEKAFQAKRKK
jgi:hypothetical protein